MQYHATAPRLHGGHQPARQPHCGHHMQVPVILPFGVIGLGNGLIRSRTGIVDQDIGPAKCLLGAIDDRVAAFGCRHICSNGRGDNVEFLRHPNRRVVSPLLVTAHQHQIDAFSGQALGHRQSDPHRAARNDCHLVAQIQVHAVSSRSNWLLLGHPDL